MPTKLALLDKYGMLSPIIPVGRTKNGHIAWLFMCDCGRTKVTRLDYVLSGRAISCGCYYRRGQRRRAEIQRVLPKSDGRCEICHKEARLDIDHDHRCCSQDKVCARCVRGRLCQECNKALGLFKDDITVLQSAIEYLRRFNGNK